MLIKIRNDKYINSERIDSLVVLERAAKCYDVFVNMSGNGVYTVSTGHKTFEKAKQVMDELVKQINNAN